MSLDTGDVWCPTCGAKPGDTCMSPWTSKVANEPHKARITEAKRRREGTPRQAPMKRTAAKKRARPKSLAPSIRDRVVRRSGGRCEARAAPDCTGRGAHRHHLVLRSLGGRDADDNLLDVCLPCHTYIHNHPEESYERGWLIHSWDADNPPDPMPAVDRWPGGIGEPGSAMVRPE